MRLSWLKQNYIGLLMLVSIALLLSIIFTVHGRISVTKDWGGPNETTEYRQNWGLLGPLMFLAVLCCPASMYIGAYIQHAKLRRSFSQISIFIPAFSGLAIVSFLDMGAYICFDSFLPREF
jgi:formate hydrogenlyase subunit 3/multisubunit Na+/H+ antiporter MnhD subunit